MTAKLVLVVGLLGLALLVLTCSDSPTEPRAAEVTSGSSAETSSQTGREEASGSGQDVYGIELTPCPTPGNDDKYLICHLPPGNPSNVREICINETAISAHLAHGDLLGECEDCEPGDPYCCHPGDPYCCHPGDPYCF